MLFDTLETIHFWTDCTLTGKNGRLPAKIRNIRKLAEDMEGVTDYSGPETTEPKPDAPVAQKKSNRLAFTGFGAVLLAALAFLLFCLFNIKTVIVSGQSMMPTLKSGQKVVVSKAYWLVGPIQDGNIVVIKLSDTPGDYIIKRVYKEAGETVDTFNAPGNWMLSEGAFKVPEGSVYVLGDNRAISEDSRKFGPVEMNKIIGKVVAY